MMVTDLGSVIPSFQVNAHTSGAQVEADVTFDAPFPPELEVAFYLMRDRSPVWRGRYGHELSTTFEVEEAGTYIVKAFAKLHGEKHTQVSAPIVVSESALLEARDLERRIPSSLPYTPLDYPHQDFALLALPEAMREVQLSKLQHEVNDMGLKLGQWSTTDSSIEVVATPAVWAENRSSLFSGLARTADRLVFGANDLEANSTEEVYESIGDFTLATRQEWGVEVRTDYFGIGRLYTYQSANLICISNRYHLLLKLILAADEKLAINRIKARANLQAVNQPFTQNFSTDMDVQGCKTVPPGSILELQGFDLKLRASAIATVLNEPTNQEIDEEQYTTQLNKAADEIVDNLRIAIDHPQFDAVRVDLTGGMDARLVFAALSRLDPNRDRVQIHTADVSGSPSDLPISLALTSKAGFEYDSLPRKTSPIASIDSTLENLSFHMGSYFGLRPETARTRLPRTLRVNGFYGEISARPYFARQIFGKPAEAMDSGDFCRFYVDSINHTQRPLSRNDELYTLLRQEFEELPGNLPAEKLDAFYLYYRNGLHCSDRWLNHVLAPGWGPLQSKELFSLKWKTFTRSKDVRLQMDITELLDSDLALLPIGRKKDNIDRASLDSRYHVPQGDLAELLDLSTSDHVRYEKARELRSAATTKLAGSMPQPVAVKNARFNHTYESWLYDAVSALHNDYEVISSREADQLRSYLKKNFNPSVSTPTKNGFILGNKILSVYYQCTIACGHSGDGQSA